MKDDDLERAIAALREQGDQPAPHARLTKERIMGDLRPRGQRRRVAWFIPLAALLAGSTVLAATGRLPDVYHAAVRVLGLESAPSREGRSPARVTRAASAASVAKAPLPEALRAAAPSSTEAIVTQPSAEPPSANTAPRSPDAGALSAQAVRRRTAKAETKQPQRPATTVQSEAATEPPAAPGPAPSAEEDPALALYRRARQLHFVEQRPGAALAAWDAYLAAEPRGPLAVDARYERALCLARLGRKQEARAALEPFAAGKYGSYRQNEARELLDALK